MISDAANKSHTIVQRRALETAMTLEPLETVGDRIGGEALMAMVQVAGFRATLK